MSHRANSYDQVRYIGFPFTQTHPDRLATVASLFGMEPAPVTNCRVLELGCGDGANLIPMAFELPGTQFLGIDLADTAIQEGRAAIAELGLRNIELKTMDVLDAGPELGRFDYIIAHGLYSWVPAEVQEKILAIASENLATAGVAYISYNAYPGAHLRTMVREMMLYHLDHSSGPEDPVEEGRAFLRMLLVPDGASDEHRWVMKGEVQDTLDRRADVVRHDELGEAFTPVYFYEFANRAARRNLQYVAEANFQDMQRGRFSPDLVAEIGRMCGSDRIRQEQYMDFLRCRRFRQTLLCHAGIRIESDADLARILNLYAASPVEAVMNEGIAEFRGARGASMKTDHPLAKAVMTLLSEAWPETIHFDALWKRAQGRAGGEYEALEVANILLTTYRAGLVELHVHPPRCVRKAGERPAVSELARWQAAHMKSVTTLRHTSVDPSGPVERRLLTLMDGAHDRDALVAELMPLVACGKPKDVVAEELERNLERLARAGMLLA